MSLYKRGEIWYYSISVNGQRARESTYTSDKKKAQSIHDSRKVELREKKESGKTLKDAFKLWLTENERSDSEKSSLRVFLSRYHSRPLSEVNGHDVQDIFSDRAASTYNRMANNVRSAINMAHKRGWCDYINIPRKRVKSSKTRFLSKLEWARLEPLLAPHVRPMAQFAISTGLRQSNVFNLKWSEVDLNRSVAWVDSTDSKSDKSIPVPLSQHAIDVLKDQIGKHDVYVFTYKNKPVGSVKTSWNKSLIKAKIDLVEIGIKNDKPIYKSTFRWHDLRHTWASWHVMNGTPLPVLKELGAWHDISMVMRYAHLSPDHLTKYASNSL